MRTTCKDILDNFGQVQSFLGLTKADISHQEMRSICSSDHPDTPAFYTMAGGQSAALLEERFTWNILIERLNLMENDLFYLGGVAG